MCDSLYLLKCKVGKQADELLEEKWTSPMDAMYVV